MKIFNWKTMVLVVAFSLMVFNLAGCGVADDVEDQAPIAGSFTENSVLELFNIDKVDYDITYTLRDRETGCQYFKIDDGEITPRIDHNGEVYGCPKQQSGE